MERDELSSKIILRKFGVKGYGIYQILKEIIAENVLPTNYEDWGSVNEVHDVESLADECRTTPEELREFLTFCNQKKVFEKKNGKLFCESMLQQLDDYAERIRSSKKINETKSGQSRNLVEQSKPKVSLELELEQEVEQELEVRGNGFLQKLPDLRLPKDQIVYIKEDILKQLGDKHSERFYKLVASKVPENVIREKLAEVKQDKPKNPASTFTYKIMKYANGL